MEDKFYGKLFSDDIRSKKVLTRGSRNKTSKTQRKVSCIKTPVDLLKGKEKKKYISGREVSWNMNEILPYRVFIQQDKETQRTMLNTWRTTLSTGKILAEWSKEGLTQYRFYKIVNGLGVDKVYIKSEDKQARTKDDTSTAVVNTSEAELSVAPLDSTPTDTSDNAKDKTELKPAGDYVYSPLYMSVYATMGSAFLLPLISNMVPAELIHFDKKYKVSITLKVNSYSEEDKDKDISIVATMLGAAVSNLLVKGFWVDALEVNVNYKLGFSIEEVVK